MTAAARVDEDDDFKEVLAAGTEAFRVLTHGGASAGSAAGPAVNTWLASPRTILLFRRTRWASFAGLQLARRGYVVATYQRYLIIEAPWLVVCGLVARIGLGTEVLNIRWEREGPWGWSTSRESAER